MKRIAVPSLTLGLVLLGSAATAFASVTQGPYSTTRTDAPTPTPTPTLTDSPTPTPTPTKPTPTPTEPEFEFDFDKVKLSTATVTPGGELTITVLCPTSVSASSNAFVAAPRFVTAGDATFTGTGTFTSTLPRVVTLKVECAEYGYVTYTNRPGDNVIRPGGSTGQLPSGAPDTGDGSLAGHDGGGLLPLLAGGSAVAMAGALGALAMRRRQHREEQS